MQSNPIGRISSTVLCLLMTAAIVAPPAPGKSGDENHSKSITGFSDSQAEVETGWETKMRAIPDPNLLREYMKHLSAEPHHVGSPYDRENAEWLLAKFKEWGFDAHIEEFDVLFPTPIEREVELVAPEHFVAELKEPAIPNDPTSSQAGQLPTYNAYSADGDVTAELVYVNYGMPADYEELAKLGIDVKGKIVLARYGAGWRGVKPKVANEHGAIGCLIYSDPRDDGYFQGDTYPTGAYRPSEGVQRGSVMDMPIHPGDPLTPGWGATKDAKRIPREQAEVIMKIPVLPISYGDALPLLKAIGGPVAPEPWRGALPTTYHIGPGPAKVHLKAKFDWSLQTIRDVIAQIPGSQYPDEWVIQGNHHDAWVNGADDPISGLVTELEEARALGQLLKEGWRPKRTIIICAWDGEEPALLGSTEWCETHATELAEKAVGYLNSDSSSKGWMGLEGSHSLEHFMNDVAKVVMDPKRNKTVWEALEERRLEQAKTPEGKKEIKDRKDLRIAALGSGSDYSPFIQHIGVASMNTGFGGEDGGGVYHSIYDDFAWYSRFGDSDFTFGRALSQFNGTAVMRLADAEVLPFDFTGLADTVNKYITELEALAKDQKPAEPIDFALLKAAALKLQESAARYHKAIEHKSAGGGGELDHIKRPAELDRALYQTERRLTSDEGLPRRPWYRHLLYAPGFYTGYGVKTIPGVREALEEKRFVEVEPQMKNVSAALRSLAGQIDLATEILEH